MHYFRNKKKMNFKLDKRECQIRLFINERSKTDISGEKTPIERFWKGKNVGLFKYRKNSPVKSPPLVTTAPFFLFLSYENPYRTLLWVHRDDAHSFYTISIP